MLRTDCIFYHAYYCLLKKCGLQEAQEPAKGICFDCEEYTPFSYADIQNR
jgi:hypothetical protein